MTPDERCECGALIGEEHLLPWCPAYASSAQCRYCGAEVSRETTRQSWAADDTGSMCPDNPEDDREHAP